MDFLYTQEELKSISRKSCKSCIPNPIRYIRKRLIRRREKQFQKDKEVTITNFGLIKIPAIPSV
jgi:hypothetical protein